MLRIKSLNLPIMLREKCGTIKEQILIILNGELMNFLGRSYLSMKKRNEIIFKYIHNIQFNFDQYSLKLHLP